MFSDGGNGNGNGLFIYLPLMPSLMIKMKLCSYQVRFDYLSYRWRNVKEKEDMDCATKVPSLFVRKREDLFMKEGRLGR